MQVKKQRLEPKMEQWTGPNWERSMSRHSAYLTYMQSTSCEMLDEAQAGIKIAQRNINNLRYADDTTLMAENEEELNSLLMKVQEESEKAGLKLNIQKGKIIASDPITSWQIFQETMERVMYFIFGGSRITVNGEIKRRY